MNAAIGLVNSEWWRGRPDERRDLLDDPEWRAEYLAQFGFEAAPRPGDLQHLRSLLRRLIEAPGARDWEALDAVVAVAPVRRRVTAEGLLVVEPRGCDARWTLAEIAASLPAALATGPVRICANDECGWAFVDRSKNHSRRWCGAAACGDLARVRRHRARRAADAG